jgi:hypothetical protein
VTYGASAEESAMHDPEGEDGSHAQIARARTRGSVHRRGAIPHLLSAPTTHSVRSALEEAQQRWAGDVTDAPDATEEDLDEDPYEPEESDDLADFAGPGAAPEAPYRAPRRTRRPRPAAPEHPMPYSSWKGYSHPLRASWQTYCDGAERVIEFMPIAVVGYWTLALPAFVIHSTFRLCQDSTTSLTRTLVFVVVVVILVVGILIA